MAAPRSPETIRFHVNDHSRKNGMTTFLFVPFQSTSSTLRVRTILDGGRALKRIVLLFCALLWAQNTNAEPVKIRIGWVLPTGNVETLLLDGPGVAKHRGISYDYEPVHFGSTPEMIPALATGDLDIATLANTTAAIAIANAQMSDLRIIASELRDGYEDYFSSNCMVLNDSPIHTVADLKGKIIGANSRGGAMDLTRLILLRNAGLDVNKDVTIVEVKMPNMKVALFEHKIDMGEFSVPFVYDPDVQRSARTIFRQKDAYGAVDFVVWAARTPFLEKNRAAVVDFMEDALRGVAFLTNPANHATVVGMAATFTKQPASAFNDWLYTHKDYYRVRDLVPDLGPLQHTFDIQAELGYVKARVDAKAVTDLSFLDAALARSH
jgi:sulfonate transport system substrate-binding protein